MALPQFRPAPGSWTYDDYCALPDDGNRYEILEGELVMVPAPGEPHQFASMALSVALYVFIMANRLGRLYAAPFDIKLAPRNVVQPDIIFISNARMHLLTEANVQGSPDLAVEILSRGTRRRDRTTKFRIYAEHGIAHFWIVDPVARTLEAYQLTDNTYTLTDRRAGDETFEPALFPGLSIPLATLWS